MIAGVMPMLYPRGSLRGFMFLAFLTPCLAAAQESPWDISGSEWDQTPPASEYISDDVGGRCDGLACEDLEYQGMASASCGDSCDSACWAWQADALVLWRSAPRNRPLLSVVNPATTSFASTALNANQLQSDPVAAGRLGLLRRDACGRAIEGVYLWAGNFYADGGVTPVRHGYGSSPPGVFGNRFGPEPATALDSGSTSLIANLQTAEINLREPIWADYIQFLIGFRWLQWNETLRLHDSFSSPPAAAPVTLTGNDYFQTECFNNLYGGQIGLDGILYQAISGLRIDGLVKAGAFYNDAFQRSAYSQAANNTVLFSSQNRSESPDGAAFVGEVGLTAIIPIHRNLDFRLGYFGLWIESLAQPSNQLGAQSISPTAQPASALDLTGGVVIQGVNLGLEGRW